MEQPIKTNKVWSPSLIFRGIVVFRTETTYSNRTEVIYTASPTLRRRLWKREGPMHPGSQPTLKRAVDSLRRLENFAKNSPR